MAILLAVLLGVGILTLWIGRMISRGVNEFIGRVPPDPFTTPAAYGLAFTEVWFKTSDGLRLHGWFIPAKGVAPQSAEDADWGPLGKGTVIFCHGRFGSKDPDLKYVPWFHEAGYNVFMFDFRGHGRSDGQYCSYGYYEVEDMRAAIALLKPKGQGPFGALGFSFGGATAITAAAQIPEIACVASDGGFVRIRNTMVRGSGERGYPVLLARIFSSLTLTLAGRRLGCNLEEADPIRWVDKISPRALFVIHGGRDKYVATADVHKLYDAAGESKELWIEPEAEHRRVDELRPEEYRERLLSFFDRYLASKGEVLRQTVQEARTR